MNIGPNRCHHNRTVSWQMSIAYSWSRSSTLGSDRGKVYIVWRMTSGLGLGETGAFGHELRLDQRTYCLMQCSLDSALPEHC